MLNIHCKDGCWSSNTLATWCKELTHLKRPWCWERLKVGEGDDRGWDGWMASLNQWTWIWVSSGSWWWTGRPGVLQSWGHKESDTSEQLNWSRNVYIFTVWNLCLIRVRSKKITESDIIWDRITLSWFNWSHQGKLVKLFWELYIFFCFWARITDPLADRLLCLPVKIQTL